MSTRNFSEVIEQIRKGDPRFEKGAYVFVRQALDHTLEKVKKEPPTRANLHVTPQELLHGIRDFALDQYGPMAFTLLQDWGVRRCQDFGDLVFHLVEYGVLGKTENDRPEDFAEGYDFKEAFLQPFEPRQPRLPAAKVRLDETPE